MNLREVWFYITHHRLIAHVYCGIFQIILKSPTYGILNEKEEDSSRLERAGVARVPG